MPSHLLRDRLLVTLSAVIWIGGTLVGMGLVGGEGVAEQGEGLFSDSATLIAPHGPAFSIWGVIYVFLAAYVLWQWTPAGGVSRWGAVTRLPAAASLALNGIWLGVVYAGWILMSVLVMIGIVIALGRILSATADLPEEGWGPRLAVAVTFGLYLGWICVATCANIASWLVGLGVPAAGTSSVLATIVVLAVVLALSVFLLSRTRQRAFQVAFGAAVAWGCAWVAVGRSVGDLTSGPVAVAAGVVATGVVVAAAVAAARATRSRHVRAGNA